MSDYRAELAAIVAAGRTLGKMADEAFNAGDDRTEAVLRSQVRSLRSAWKIIDQKSKEACDGRD